MSVRMGVVGAGRMGKLHCRVLSEMTGVELVCVVDAAAAAAAAVAAQYGAIALNRAEDAVERVDAAIVAVPTSAHVEAARPFVAAGKPVLIEKPLADSSAEGEELIALAERTGRPSGSTRPSTPFGGSTSSRSSSKPTASARSRFARPTSAW